MQLHTQNCFSKHGVAISISVTVSPNLTWQVTSAGHMLCIESRPGSDSLPDIHNPCFDRTLLSTSKRGGLLFVITLFTRKTRSRPDGLPTGYDLLHHDRSVLRPRIKCHVEKRESVELNFRLSAKKTEIQHSLKRPHQRDIPIMVPIV